jgi:hypothetical protein
MVTTDEAMFLLLMAKANWAKQATDDLTVALWHEIFSGLEVADVKAALMDLIRNGQPEPPSAGELYQFALRQHERAMDRARYAHRALPEPGVTAEQRSANVKFLRELGESIGRRI